MISERISLRFGETAIEDSRVQVRVKQRVDNPSTAELVVPNELLIFARPDYRAEVKITRKCERQEKRIFTGFVDRAIPEGSTTRFSLVTPVEFMRESGLGGLGIAEIDPREMIWSIMRTSGFRPEEIVMEGWEPDATEVFEVAAPVEGILPTKPMALGRVRLLPGGPVSSLPEGLGPEELEEAYASGPAWALVTCTAKTVLEAEIEGIKELDFALAWLTARAQYSSVSLPDRQTRAYKRQWTLSRIRRKDAVVVRGLSTGRMWLRALQDIPSRPSLPLHEITDIELPVLPPDVPLQLREAINAWRRATETADPFEAVVALNDALEFYVSGVNLPRLFSPSELKSICKNAANGLTSEQKSRVNQVVSNMLNNPSHKMKINKALDENQVPHTAEELDLLKRVRDNRNGLVHGRSSKALFEADIRYAVGFVNRMLVYAVAKLSRESNSPL